ncbi:response regulator transcription factor [Agromyces atrinae]|uniref:response regulator n=1 Tax=Agromyces atrinae TaxID=592376 RepID=UPI001F575F76|nr:response regulator transcription factor [Agromyces atrinae]MCI2957216.1 response regulator transcription factor [Agromyces atrinae]
MADIVTETNDSPIRVVIVDDDALVRKGLVLLLGADPGIRVVGEAVDGLDAEAVIARGRPDVVLMDIRMPRCDGIAATAREIAARPSLAVLVLTTFDADDDVVRALQAGARGYLLKDSAPTDLVAAVRAAAAGTPTLAPAVLERVIRLAAHSTRPRSDDERRALDSLTAREREVADAVARGLSNAEIAADLYLTIATVKSHVGRVMAKLDASSRVQVAVIVNGARPTG